MIKGQRTSAVYLTLFLAGAAAVFGVLFKLAGARVVPGQEGYRVEAILPDSFGLSQNADVRQAGVKIGRVTATRGLGATTAALLELDDDHAPVYRDGTVLIRSKSIAGENYLELEPGSPAAGAIPDGGRLTIDHTREATQLDDVLSVLDAPRRRRLQGALRGLGGGLERRGGDLNRSVEAMAATVDRAAPVMETLAAERQHVGGLVDSFERVMRALGERREAIGILVRQAKVAAEATAARDRQLERTLAELPGFLVQARGTAARLRDVSVDGTPVIRDLRLAVQDLVPAIEDLRAAAPDGRRVVRALGPFARALRAPAAQLGPFSDATSGAVGPLAATLRQVNPLLAYLSPYSREVGTVFGQIGAATKYSDSVGHLGRLGVMLGRGSLPGTLPLEQLAGSTSGVNGYPAAGEAGLAEAFAGEYPRLAAEPR